MAENLVADSILMCDRCGSYSGITVEYFEQYRIPEEYDTLCTDCADEENTHTAEEMNDEELVAAIMDDSIGYASPTHAAKHVEDFREGGEKAFCERGAAVFDRDLAALIESARAHWLRIEQGNPEKAEQLLETVEQWREVEAKEGSAASMGISVLYPTHGPSGGGQSE
jgi:hypothetical protein